MTLLRKDGSVVEITERRPKALSVQSNQVQPASLIRPLEEVERQAIESAMILAEGNRSLAALRLRIAYRTLLRRLDTYRRADR